MNAIRVAIAAGLIFIAGASAASGSAAIFPRPISALLPVYPEEARTARVAGTVKLWFMLNGGGQVTKVGIASGNPMLRDAALTAVKSWRFQPTTLAPNVRLETEFVYILNVQPNEGGPKLTVSITDFLC